MTAYYVRPGEEISYTPEADVAAGDVIVVGNFLCVALRPIAAGDTGSLACEGVFDFPKAEADFETGDEAYWHISGGNMVKITDSSEESSGEDAIRFAGLVTKDAGPSESRVHVRLRNAHQPAD